MKIVIPGGSGQVGRILARAFRKKGHQVILLSRSKEDKKADITTWDAKTLGAWTNVLEGADVLINLAGKTVNCRYHKRNLQEMMDSRVNSARIVAKAIEQAKNPPRIFLQMSTATIYAHRFDAPNDEKTGLIGGDEQNVPSYWGYSIEIAKAWEKEILKADLTHTRKVLLRTAMVMSSDKGGVFDVLSKMVRYKLGGAIGGGKQFVSWIHKTDFVRAIEFLIENESIEGAINLAAPTPLPQKEFMKVLREAYGTNIGLPATKWMAEIAAFFLRTDTELLLKSRRVIPGRLLDLGFRFQFPTWQEAVKDLVQSSY